MSQLHHPHRQHTVPVTHVFLQIERLVVQQRLHHPHQVDEQGEVELHHVHLDALEDEVAEPRQHLVKTRVRRQTLQRLLRVVAEGRVRSGQVRSGH